MTHNTINLEDLSALLNNSSTAILVYRDQSVLYANHTLLNQIEYKTLEDFQAHFTPSQFIHPDDYPTVLKNVEARIAQHPDVPRDYDFRVKTKTGKYIWYNCRADRIIWHGKPAISAHLFDITETRELQLQKILFKNFFDLCPDIITLTKRETGEYINVNNAFCNTFKISKEDAIGKNSRAIGIYKNPSNRDDIFSDFQHSNVINNKKIEVQDVYGNSLILMMNATSININNHDLILLISTDITDSEMKKLEIERQAENAMIANKAKTEFLANMSHELRTPLNSILGFSETIMQELMGKIDNPVYKEYAGHIHESGKHLLSIINDILDLSKVEAGAMGMSYSSIDLLEVIHGCFNIMDQECLQKGIAIKNHIKPGEFLLSTDARRLKQVMLNIISNALKYTQNGGFVEINAILPNSEQIEISIRDTGIGMTHKEQMMALSTFGRSNDPFVAEQSGTGLGLPVSAAIIRALNGDISIQSAKGEGTTIHITLPLNESMPAAVRGSA